MRNLFKVAKVTTLALVCTLFLGIGMKAEAASSVQQVDDSSSSVSISWTGSAEKYLVEYCQNKYFSGSTYRYGVAGSNSVRISGLAAGKSYYVRVRDLDSAGNMGVPTAAYETVTAPAGRPAGLKQTKAESKAITMAWNRVSGANAYEIAYLKHNSSIPWKYVTVKKNISSYRLKASANSKYSFAVWPARVSTTGYVAYGTSYAYKDKTATMPGKISKVKMVTSGSSTNPKSGVVYFSWGKNDAVDGYQYEIFGNNGKKILSKTTKSYRNVKAVSSKLKNNQFMKIRVRGYITVNGKKKYGSWSSSYYFAKFPNIKTKVSGNDLKVSWDKISGAKNYTVYVSSKATSGYKKVATTSKKSYTISNVKSGKSYYLKVVANKKVKSKTYTGDKTWYLRVRIY